MSTRRMALVMGAGAALLAAACGGSASPPATTSPAGHQTVTVSASPPAGFLPYTDTARGFFIAYPKSWTDRGGAAGTARLFMAPVSGASDTFRENVNVVEEDVPSGTTLDEYTAAALGQVRSHIGSMHIVRQGDIPISGTSGHYVVYTGVYPSQQGSHSLEWMQAYTVDGTRAFVITYTGDPKSFSATLPQAQEMVTTFVAI